MSRPCRRYGDRSELSDRPCGCLAGSELPPRHSPNRGSLIGLRAALRADGDYDLADPVRGALVAADIELRDQPATTFWQLRNTHHER